MYGLELLIREATRITDTSATCLDNIITNINDVKTHNPLSHISDHNTTQICDFAIGAVPLVTSKMLRDYSNADVQNFMDKLGPEEWTDVYSDVSFDWVPQDVHSEWSRWTSDLQKLAELKITRHVIAVEPRWIELHGFSDASENAYGCCIYARSSDTNNLIRTRLICAKTRVAPAKVISIPRLELSGALLLARLMDKVSQALNVNIRETFYWCDSTIVQAWIRHVKRI
ncbi:Pao retrotransposon peptidase [Popillia japonica]|uniref:Pao retrotransposon peptidase n=1 Tax=Popillia japonica TaxID=7064 RepID=A0AAW1KQK9_POPJA